MLTLVGGQVECLWDEVLPVEVRELPEDLARLDRVLENCAVGASGLLESVLNALNEFTGGQPAHDDQTILVAKIS